MENKTKELDFKKYPEGLMPVIVQDYINGRILMQAFATKEALEMTFEKGLATFFSRSQGKLWTKGESKSGNTLKIKNVMTDCDNDCLVYQVEAKGPACDTGAVSCFYKEVLPNGTIGEVISKVREWSCVILEEEKMILGKKSADPKKSATAEAFASGDGRIAQKFGEEAVEVVCALLDEEQGKEKIISETADLMYRLQIALVNAGINRQAVETEIKNRRK